MSMIVFSVMFIPLLIYYIFSLHGGFGAHWRKATGLRSNLYLHHGNAMVKLKEIDGMLSEHSPYYNRLSEKNKQEFLLRTFYIHKKKRFFSTERQLLNYEKEIYLASLMAQLSFGLQTRYWLPSFELIRIHPDSFYSGIVDAEVNGLTINETIIHLSWKHVELGKTNHADGRHLAMHEFAHALYLDIHDYKFFNPFSFSMNMAKELYQETKEQHNHIFSGRDASTPYEFWAVSVEFFFENPEKLFIEMPLYYKTLAQELKQDPLGKFQNFPFADSFKSVNN